MLDALARAEIALTNEDWAAADGHLKEARGLDGDAPGVATLSETLKRERRRQALEAALGEGYDALTRQDYAGAQSAFNKALSLNGGAAAAEEGLALVATQRLEARLAALQDQAEAARRAEAFSEALAHYEAALALDGNLAFAQEGRQAMTDRLALAGALTEAERTLGKDPSDAVLRHARETLALAAPFLSAEPRLAEQVEALRIRLAAAETPRTVRLESDGKTTVQVLKVRHLAPSRSKPFPYAQATTSRWGPAMGIATLAFPSQSPWKQPRPPSPWFADVSSMTSEPIAPSPYVPGSAPPPSEERRRRRRWPWFAALLLLPPAFVFLAQGLTVQVTPRKPA